MMTNEIPVVFAANNEFVPYLGVAISSLIACADDKNVYCVFVLHTSITRWNQERLEGLSTRNVTVRCKNISSVVSGLNIVHNGRLTFEATFRILIPELFPQYDKVLYLDCDLVVMRDIAQLYAIDLDGNVIGATWLALRKSFQKYLVKMNLGFLIEDYFASGVILINTKRFIQLGIKEKSFQFLNNEHSLDQYALNVTCHGNVKFIDGRWNVHWHYWFPDYKFYTTHEEDIFNRISADPWIVHFASVNKPWAMPEAKFADYFWRFARISPFYEEIVYKNNMKKTDDTNVDCFRHHLCPYESVPFGSTVAIYGAGGVGQAFCQQIKITGLYKLVVLVDRNYEGLQEQGFTVYSPESLQMTKFDWVLIAVETQSVADEINKNLIELGVDENKIIWTNPRVGAKWECWTKQKSL